MDKLAPLIKKKNEALDKMLRTNLVGAKREFRRWQRRIKGAVDKARVDWILKVATEAQEAAQDGKTRWECIRRLQQAYAGRRPCIPSAVRKEDGELTRGPTEVLQRWHQHFSRLLDQQGRFDEEVILQVPVVAPCSDFDEPPSLEELMTALSKLRKRKAGGKTGILPTVVVWWSSAT